MIIARLTPPAIVMRRAGITPVKAVNSADPTNGLVPLRTNGEVAEMMVQYDRPDKSTFHRYAGVSLVGSFTSREAASKAVPLAERSIRLNPGPGIHWPEPIDEKGRDGFILIFEIGPTGWVHSNWDPISRSVVNETLEAHLFRKGFVARQVSMVGCNVYVTTFGEGINDDEARAWANGTYGPSGFSGLDTVVSLNIMGCDGFLKTSPAVPDSIFNACFQFGPAPDEFLQ